MDFKDYYQILGIKKDATQDQIKRAFRRLAVKYHPDKNPGNKAAEAKFKEITEANEVLSDPEKRKQYDQLGSAWNSFQKENTRSSYEEWFSQKAKTSGDEEFAWSTDAEDIFERMGGFSDFFESIFGSPFSFSKRSAKYRNGQNYQSDLYISAQEALTGTEKILSIGLSRIKIKIPPGVYDGQILRIPEQGEPGLNGGLPGDLLITIHIQADHQFVRQGENLLKDLHIDLYTAVLGGVVEIRTLEGKLLRLKIPPGTDNNTVMRIPEMGLPTLHGTNGDLLVKIFVDIPKNLSKKQIELFRMLDAMQKKKGGSGF